MAAPSGWTRQTSELTPAGLDPAMRAAIEQAAERERVTIDLGAASAGTLTVSERAKRRLFGSRAERTESAHLIVGELLVVVVRAGQAPPVASFLPLREIEVRPLSSPLVSDVGLEVIGHAVGATERSSRFLALDEGPAGRAFRLELDGAIAAAR